MTKKTLLTVAGVSMLSAGVVVASTAFAQTTSNSQSTVPSLVQEIADKFHLNTSDIQSVFNQHKHEMLAKREANYENYLGNLVKNGKITEEQEQLILNKHKQLMSQMQSNLPNFKTMTPAQRRAQLQATQQDLQHWAEQNNINLQYLRPFGFGMRWKGRFGRVIPTPTQ